ncbi:MAG: competence/damage-inducible protein A [Chitinophagales bacterium]|nr:competence/damage-inducible protein A [Chitinophagales bacterium]
MKAILISIGDELLNGQTINTNVSYISQEMNKLGISVLRHITISDEKLEIINNADTAIALADIVIITGGLGPTSDDITKQVLCEYFGGELILNELALKNIQEIFIHRGRTINDMSKQVAYVPNNCTVFQNSMGTAPGMLFTKNKSIIVSMPGVPYEMKAMVEKSLIPYIKEEYQLPIIIHKHILTVGVGETAIAEKIEPIIATFPTNLSLAYLPSVGKVKLRLTAKGNDKQALQTLIDKYTKQISEVLAVNIYGYDDDVLEAVIGKILLQHNLQLGLAESCTGGYIAHLITSISGSSQYFKGGIVSYANTVKEELLWVQQTTLETFGAVSEETVTEMLNGALKQLQVNVAVAISGVAGPNGGTTEKPVGTVYIGVSNGFQTKVKRFNLTKDRMKNIELSAVIALEMLRRFLWKNYPI